MGELVNLRQVKKSRAKAQAAHEAAANRAVFGRSKAEKAHQTAEDILAARRLDQARLVRDDET